MRCDLASYLDVAVLNPELRQRDVLRILEDLAGFQPCAFCLRPSDIALARPLCREHRIGLCAESVVSVTVCEIFGQNY